MGVSTSRNPRPFRNARISSITRMRSFIIRMTWGIAGQGRLLIPGRPMLQVKQLCLVETDDGTGRLRWAEALAGVELISLIAFAWLSLRDRRMFDGVLSGTLLAASLLSLWAVTRSDRELFDHEARALHLRSLRGHLIGKEQGVFDYARETPELEMYCVDACATAGG